MGAVIRRLLQVARWLGILLVIAAAVPAMAAQRQPKKSPHGSLNIPCENCHTATSWAPIRAIPEFNHDLTKYPLRGMHEKVACTGCHVKPVFTDVGKHARTATRISIAASSERIAPSATQLRVGRFRFNRSRSTSTGSRCSARMLSCSAMNAIRTRRPGITWGFRRHVSRVTCPISTPRPTRRTKPT